MSLQRTALLVVVSAALFSGCPKPPAPVTPSAAPRVISFTASDDEVAAGSTVTLSWETAGGVAVELREAKLGMMSVDDATAAAGSVQVTLTADSLYTLTVLNDRGVRDNAALGVRVEDGATEVFFTAAPARVESGETATLAWTAPNARNVTLQTSDGTTIDIGGQVTTGAVEVTPAQTTAWTLTVDGVPHVATVHVLPAVASFKAGALVPGQSSTVQWQVAGATKVTLSAAGRGQLAQYTDPAEISDGSFTEMIPSSIDPARAITYVLRAEGASGDVVTRELTLFVAGDPRVRRFSAPRYGLETSTFEVSWETSGADQVEVLADGVVIHVSRTAEEASAGSLEIPTPLTETQYAVRALHSRGGMHLGPELPVAPVGKPHLLEFKVTPGTATAAGDPVILSWHVPEARHVRIRIKDKHLLHEDTGLAAESGSFAVYPNGPTEYLLEADNTIGHAIDPATTTATSATIAKLNFSPALVPYGGTSRLGGATVPGDLVAWDFAVRNAPGESFIDISQDGTPTGHPVSTTATMEVVELGETFTFPIFDQVIRADRIAVNNRGWFSLDPSTVHVSATAPSSWLTVDLPPLAFAPYWETLQKDASAEIYWRLDGTGPDRRLIVQWENNRYSSTTTKRMTFQAQLYASGKVVFAYPQVYARTLAADTPSIGIVGPDGSTVLAARPQQLDPDERPYAGDTFTFFGIVPPNLDVGAYPQDYTALVNLAGGGQLEVTGRPGVLLPGEFWISEANPTPDVSAPEGEWFELTNTTNTAYDLSGWTIDFGNGLLHTVPTTASLVLPPQGTLLFAASGDPALNGDLTPDYVYGAGFPLGDAAGSIQIGMGGAGYDRATWAAGSGHATGVSVRFDPVLINHFFLSGVTQSTCAGTGSYGTQTGSPGQRVPGCFPYRMEALAQGAFEPINATGTKLGPASTTSSDFSVTVSVGAGLPVPIKWGNKTYNTLTVTDNGYLALRDVPTEAQFACSSATSCYATNKTSYSTTAPVRIVAPFWDSLSAAGTAPTTGIYLLRRDPDPTVSGDEYTIVSWETWRWSTTTTYDLNFQVKLFDNGNIEYHYGTMAGPTLTNVQGQSATVWLESEAGNAALVYKITTLHGPNIEPDSGIRYRFVP